MTEQTYYEITIAGEYYANVDGRKTFYPYEEVFKLPTMDCALSVIKNKLLDDRLRKTAKHYVGFRTHRLKSVKAHGSVGTPDKGVLNMPIEQLDHAQLRDFCVIRGFSVDPFKYDLTEARQEVLKANARWQTEQVSKREEQEQRDADNALRKLNDLPPIEEGGLILQDTPTPSDDVSRETPVNLESDDKGEKLPPSPAQSAIANSPNKDVPIKKPKQKTKTTIDDL
jgi:hypothetical protein